MTTFKTLIDAIVDDLEANASLSTHKTWKYVEPNGLRDDLGPWLVVYPQRIRNEVIATSTEYQHDRVIIVRWQHEAFEAASVNKDAQQDAEAQLVEAEAILDRLETYGAGVPSHTESAVIEEAEFKLRNGPAWSAEFRVRVEEFS